MIPPKPTGQRQLDLEEAGKNITNAQNHCARPQVPIMDPQTGKIIYVNRNDPRAVTDAAKEAEGRPVF